MGDGLAWMVDLAAHFLGVFLQLAALPVLLGALAVAVGWFVVKIRKENMKILVFVALLLLSACSLPSGTRKITAWGFWGVLAGFPVGVGYWHSEHGENVKGEDSANPPMPLK